MKNLKLLQILLLLTLSACDGCDEEQTTLPPETQTGANTFGCYVDGQLFITERGYGYLGMPNPLAIYSRSNNSLGITAVGKGGDMYMYIELSDTLLFDMNYSSRKNNIFYTETNKRDELNKGKIHLTKFDTINKIASGIFSGIKLINDQSEKDSVMITQGRFDIKLDIYE